MPDYKDMIILYQTTNISMEQINYLGFKKTYKELHQT